MTQIGTPHDRFFRETFSRIEIARDFLSLQLPAPLLAELDLSALEIGKDTYVTKELSESFSDLVYRVPLYRAPAGWTSARSGKSCKPCRKVTI